MTHKCLMMFIYCQMFCAQYRDWCPKFATDKCPLLDHFYLGFFWLLHRYLSQNWGSDGHLKCWTKQSKKTQKNHNINQSFFTKLQKTRNRNVCVLSHTYQLRSAPQNDCLNLSFVKDIHVGAKKWQEMVAKWPFISGKFWASVSRTFICN